MRGKMVGLFAAVLIAIMVAGLAYAHWSETLVISGTVNTGKLDLELSCTCSDNDDTLKDVADVTCVVQNETEPNSITITVRNAYPCYEVSGTIDITNVGTVPAKYKSVNIEPPTGTQLVTVTPYYKYNLTDTTTGKTLITIDLSWDPNDFLQIDVGETDVIEFSAHFEEDVAENWNGQFSITIIYENWSP